MAGTSESTKTQRTQKGGNSLKICNFGSMNMDYVYQVDAFLLPGETKSSDALFVNCGGKGLNQSIAAAKAGNDVIHAGLIGTGGEALEQSLKENGVDVALLEHKQEQCGHAIIQVEQSGQNCILLYGGTNQMLTESYVDGVLDKMGKDTLVLLQNETNLVGNIIEKAHAKGMKIALNAAPMNKKVLSYPLDLLDWLIINEVEGKQIAECQNDDEILPILQKKYPKCNILLTLGSRGAICVTEGKKYQIGCYQVPVVDTTAAGDTFSGYFLYGVLHGKTIADSLLLATTASAIAIGKKGAANSIPLLKDVEDVIAKKQFGTLEVSVTE